jgi:Mg2+ and Co2+ transporter CorA
MQGKKQRLAAEKFLLLAKYGSLVDFNVEQAPEFQSSQKILDIYPEADLAQEIEDVSDDVQIMTEIQRDQDSVIDAFKGLIPEANRRTEELARKVYNSAVGRLQRIMELQKSVRHVQNSVSPLPTLPATAADLTS